MAMSSNPLDVITFGEAMLLLIAEQPGPLENVQTFRKRSAGAETNVAMGLSRLGLKVGWASRLGTDAMGRYLLSVMQSEGIDCSHVVCDSTQKTGFQFKGQVTDGSDPPVESYRQGSAATHMGPDDIDVPWLLSARHLHATGVFAAISNSSFFTAQKTMDLMRRAGRSVSFDPNLRPGLWATPQRMREGINDLAIRANWVLPGLEEGQFLTGESTPELIASFYLQRGVDAVIVKLGSQGAFFAGKEGTGSGYVPAFPVAKVVDTVGAGDGFAVGVISALLEGMGFTQAVDRGVWIGARAVQVLGDNEGLPTRAELDQAFAQSLNVPASNH